MDPHPQTGTHAVLFVCTANRIRSPLAALFWRELCQTYGQSWRIESAGTWARDGVHAGPTAQEIAHSRGLSLAEHRSRPVTSQLLRQFPLIITMEQGQKEALQAEFPEIAGRVYRLTELVGGVHDVRDPVGGSRGQFEAVALELAALLEQAAPSLVRLAQVA